MLYYWPARIQVYTESLTLYIIVNEWREEYESAFKAGSMTLYNNKPGAICFMQFSIFANK